MGLKILICATASPAGQAAAEFGGRLAQAAAGPTTLLAVAGSLAEVPVLQAQLEAQRAQWAADLPRLEVRVRRGQAAAEITHEAREGLFEVVVLGRVPASTLPGQDDLGAIARHLLAQAEVPVLLVATGRPKVERMLICTAGGEPGKSDVHFGGRLARRTNARVTVLHVHRASLAPGQRLRRQGYLQRAQASLEALGVQSDVKIEQGPEVETMLRETEAGDYDLIVIGAPAPRAPQQLRWRDFAAQIVGGTHRPVLVVPMRE
jgi:nucleotide-binding universal stress UspA family protein